MRIIDHQPRWLASSTRRSWWKCECGAEGQGWGHPSIGWSNHVAEVVSSREEKPPDDTPPE